MIATPIPSDSEIVSRLDLLGEYQTLGLVLTGSYSGGGEKAECFAISRDEQNPSAFVSVSTGRYVDMGPGGENLSLWDFAARYGNGQFSDWKAAKRFYADKAGLPFPASQGGSGKGGKSKNKNGKGNSKSSTEKIKDVLSFRSWSRETEMLAWQWCRDTKPGCTVLSIKANGGLPARYQCMSRTYNVLAMPCYGPQFLAADPVAWIVFPIPGGKLPKPNGKDEATGEWRPPTWLDKKAIGPTRGTIVGKYALEVLSSSDPFAKDEIELVVKAGGPTDLLALWAIAPERLKRSHLIVSPGSSETGDVLPHQLDLFRGRKALICDDADEAGLIGDVKWLSGLAGEKISCGVVELPWKREKKKGRDARDFVLGVAADG